MKTARNRGKPLSPKARFIGAAIGGVLAWQTLSISLAAEHHDEVTDVSATEAVSPPPFADTAAAKLQNDNPDDADAVARQALMVSPISSAALRKLGFAEQDLGNSQQSSALLSQAAALGWRDEPTQLWLAAAYLHSKDYPHAAERLDAALRTDPSSTTLFDVLNQLLADRHLAAAMVGRLTLAPIWRTRYLQYGGNSARDAVASRALLISNLIRSPAPPSRSEILSVVAMLIHVGRAAQARDLWLAVQHASGNVYDPEFEHVMTSGASSFEWTEYPVLGVSIISDPDAGGLGKGISVSADGSAAGILLRQLVTLAPGRHTIDYVGVLPTRAQNAFGWQVRCASGASLVSTMGAVPRPNEFVVPDGCETQYIELRVFGDPRAAGSKVAFHRLGVR